MSKALQLTVTNCSAMFPDHSSMVMTVSGLTDDALARVEPTARGRVLMCLCNEGGPNELEVDLPAPVARVLARLLAEAIGRTE